MSMSPVQDPGVLASPCVGICHLDPATGWCLGCARDVAEIGRWAGMDAADQAVVWADLPRRKEILGLGFRLLPWAGEAMLDRLLALARRPGTGWSMGVYGAVAGFPAAGQVESDGRGLTLRAPGGALRLRPRAGMRAFELVGDGGRVERIVLAMHRSRLREPLPMGVTEMGADEDAIDEAARRERLFDLGLNRPPIRFCVRTGDASLIARLRSSWGRSVLDPAASLVPELLSTSPCRVVTTLLGRIEVAGSIGSEGHAGPHSHLLPDLLARNRVLEPGFELPEGYVACASLFPGSVLSPPTAAGSRAG